MLKNVTKAYLMLFVLALLAMAVSFIPSPINIMPNPGNLIGTAALLNPDYRPQSGQNVPVFNGRPQNHLKPAPDLQLLLSEPCRSVWQ